MRCMGWQLWLMCYHDIHHCLGISAADAVLGQLCVMASFVLKMTIVAVRLTKGVVLLSSNKRAFPPVKYTF